MRFRANGLVYGVGAFAAVLSPHAAHAQDVSASPTVGTQFDRRRSVAVGERVQQGYEELGRRVGGFVIYPRIKAVAAFDNNVLAQSSDAQGDVAFSLEPSVRAVSEWTRHQVGLSATAAATRFAKLETENSETFAVRADGRYDAGDELRLYAYTDYRRDVERRSAPGALRVSQRPAAYNTASAGAQLTWQGNRLRLQASGSAAKIDYADIVFRDGLVIDSRELDRSRYQAALRADYAVNPNLAVLVGGTIGKTDFDPPPGAITPDRSARRAELLGGVSFEFTDLLRGEVALGYIHQDFRTPGLKGFGGLGGRAELEYFPTRLTTVRLDASRTLQEAGNPIAPSFRRTRVGVRVDHELYRQVLVSAFADYEASRFQLPDRTEHRPHAGMSGQYLLDRHVTLFARYDYLRIRTRPVELGRRLGDSVVSVGVLFKP